MYTYISLSLSVAMGSDAAESDGKRGVRTESAEKCMCEYKTIYIYIYVYINQTIYIYIYIHTSSIVV